MRRAINTPGDIVIAAVECTTILLHWLCEGEQAGLTEAMAAAVVGKADLALCRLGGSGRDGALWWWSYLVISRSSFD